MTARKLRWGIIGTGKIARTFAYSLAQSQSGELVLGGKPHARGGQRVRG